MRGATRSFRRSFSRSFRRSFSLGASALGITGSPYPGETLTFSESGQWYVDDVSTGSPSTTYTVDVRDIGKSVRCGDSNPVTIWHPTDVTTNMILLTPNVGALHSIDPDVEATDGQTVRRILDQSGNGWHADQATGANQPIRKVGEVGGNDTLLFDGTNDLMSFSGGALSLFRNRGYGYIISSQKNIDFSGSTSAAVAWFANNAASTRLGLYTDFVVGGVDDDFAFGGRRLDGEAANFAPTPQNVDYNVLSGSALWSSGEIIINLNGDFANNSNFASSGNSANTPSGAAHVGFSPASNYFPGHISCLIILSPDSALSGHDLSLLERYAGLCAGLDIPFVGGPP